MRKGWKRLLSLALFGVFLIGGFGVFSKRETPVLQRERELPVIAFAQTSVPDYDEDSYYLVTLYYGNEVAYVYAEKGVRNNLTLASIQSYFPSFNADGDETFLGWYDDSGKLYAVGTSTLRKDLTIYAKVEKKETVKISVYDGEELLFENAYPKDESYRFADFNLTPPVKFGYAFVGWKDEAGNRVDVEEEKTAVENRSYFAEYSVGKAYGASVSLSGDVAFNLYMEFTPETYGKDLEIQVGFNGAEKTMKISDGTPVLVGDIRYYKYSFSMAAKDFDKAIQFTVVSDTGRGFSDSFSAKEYMQSLLESEDYEKEKPLVSALLNYCSAAKGYFYSSIMPEISVVEKETVQDYAGFAVGSEQGVTLLGGTLSLETKTALRIYFVAETEQNCKIDGVRVTPKWFYENGQKIYYLEIANISAQDLDALHKIDVGSIQIQYCGYSYAYDVLSSSSDAALGTLARALFLYGEAANEYFA